MYFFIYFIYLLFLFFFGYILYLTCASKIRAGCIIVQYNDGSKAPIPLFGRGRPCVAFARSKMLDLYRRFNPVDIE